MSATPGVGEEVSEVANQYGSSATLLLLVFQQMFGCAARLMQMQICLPIVSVAPGE